VAVGGGGQWQWQMVERGGNDRQQRMAGTGGVVDSGDGWLGRRRKEQRQPTGVRIR